MKTLDNRYVKEHILYFGRRWELADNLIYKDSALRQNCFVRDRICGTLLGVPCFKLSWHTSKSCRLPVYGFVMRNGVKVICRNNFYDWKLSIEVPTPLAMDFIPDDILTWYSEDDKRKDIPGCYLEGFKEEWAWPMYDPISLEQTRFTIEIGDDYQFYMLMFMLDKAFHEKTYSNARAKDEIADSIRSIYAANGFDVYEEEDGKTERIMTGYDILLFTWRAIRNCYEKEREGEYLHTDFMNDPDVVAEYICDHPEVMNVFLMEEYMFNTNFEYDELD